MTLPCATLAYLMSYTLVAMLLILVAKLASAEGFSIDAASPSVSAGSNSAILSSGPVGGPPTVEVLPVSLGLSGGVSDEINAVTFGAGAPGLTFHFSVDRASAGSTGDVVVAAVAGQAAGDLFATDLLGSNSLAINQHSLGLTPSTSSGTPTLPPVDDLDAFDLFYDGPNAADLIIYTLETGHPIMGTSVGCGGDLFLSGFLFFGYAALGLGSCLDDVDALEIDNASNTIYYSLAPGSPSLLPGTIAGCATGCSPADIFSISAGQPVASVFATASALGLLPSDNVDALALGSVQPVEPPITVPVLGTWGSILLVGLLAGSILVRSRRG